MVNRFVRFSYAIAEIDRSLHKIMSDEMCSLGLRGPHAVYITWLNMHTEGLTAAELAKLTDKNKADVSRAMVELESRGIIERKSHKNFYRAQIVLTESGRDVAEKLRARTRLAVELIGGGLPEEKREVFYEALEFISSNLHKISETGLPET